MSIECKERQQNLRKRGFCKTKYIFPIYLEKVLKTYEGRMLCYWYEKIVMNRIKLIKELGHQVSILTRENKLLKEKFNE